MHPQERRTVHVGFSWRDSSGDARRGGRMFYFLRLTLCRFGRVHGVVEAFSVSGDLDGKELSSGGKYSVLLGVILLTVQTQQSPVVEIFDESLKLVTERTPRLFGFVGLQVVWFQQLYVEIFEGFSEGRVDFIVQLRQFQELRVDGWNELKTEGGESV